MADRSTDLPPGSPRRGASRAPTKGPRPGLTLEAIVAAAIDIADEEGLDAVSMNRVAKRLGSSPMSLYRYVASKEELLALMVDAALGTMPDRRPRRGWRERLERCAWSTCGAMRAHPWSTHVPITGPPLTPNAVAWLEDALAALRDTGLRRGREGVDRADAQRLRAQPRDLMSDVARRLPRAAGSRRGDARLLGHAARARGRRPLPGAARRSSTRACSTAPTRPTRSSASGWTGSSTASRCSCGGGADRVAQDRRRGAAAGMSSRRNASTRPPWPMTLRAISSTTP